MSPLNFTHILTQAVDELSESESYKGLFHQHKDGEPLPSAKVLYEIIELSRSILFPDTTEILLLTAGQLIITSASTLKNCLTYFVSKSWPDCVLALP